MSRRYLPLHTFLTLLTFLTLSVPLAFGAGDGKLRIYFVDIGQGDASLIIGPDGSSCVVDGGPSNSSGDIIASAMSDAIAAGYADNQLDHVVNTHMHDDHIDGLEIVYNAFPGALINAHDRGGSRSITAFTEYDNVFGTPGLNKRILGGGFNLGTATMTYLGRETGGGTSDENNNGIMYRLDFGVFKGWFGGDLGLQWEAGWGQTSGNVDVYQVNHHGSNTSSQTDFLNFIDPEAHVFSYGVGNTYGHPTQGAIDRCAAVGSTRYDTINHYLGTKPYVYLETNGTTYFSVNGTNFPLSGGGDITPPAAPTGLAAVGGDATVSLDWNDNTEPDLAGYNVKRSTTSGGPYTQINGALVTSSAYNDNTVTNGTTYFYVVTAVDTSSNESGNSNEASATPQASPPQSVQFTSVAADDGYILEKKETTNTGGSISATGTTLRVGDDVADKQWKSIVSFDTSSLPDGATIVSATLTLTRSSLTGDVTAFGNANGDISPAFGGNVALATGDFQASAAATGVVSLAMPSANGQTTSGNLNSAGLSNINKTGKTQIRLAFSLDDNDDLGNDYMSFFSGNNSTGKPTLQVTFIP
ncbi:MAG: MBL fold metallo-hydrolase [bacterium]